MPNLNPLDDIMTYRQIADQLSGRVTAPSNPAATLDPRIVNRTASNGLTAEGLANRDATVNNLQVRAAKGSPQLRDAARYLGNGLPSNYENMAVALARSHGPEVVNSIIRTLPTLSRPQILELSALLQQALREADAGKQVPLQAMPKGSWE